MGFGAEIKRLREETNMAAAKFARIIGVDAERLRKWEQKDLTPKDEDTQIIEKFFGMSLAEISKLDSVKKFLNVPRGQTGNAEVKKEVELSKEIGFINERLITLEAMVKVANMDRFELQAKVTGNSYSTVALSYEEKVLKEIDRTFAELKRKSG